jgi:hypothetical protein
LPFQEDLYQLRTNTTQSSASVQTPIFIGTASKLVSVTSLDGSGYVDVSQTDLGLIFNISLSTATASIWFEVGQYEVTAIDLTKTVLFCNTTFQAENIEIGQQQYTCFIYDDNTGNVIFTTSLSSATFVMYDAPIKDIQTLIIEQPIPTTFDITASNIHVFIAYIKNYVSIPSDFYSYGTDLYFYPNAAGNDICFDWANNINALISVNFSLYFNIIDYRLITINLNDTIPDWLSNTTNNKLGQALVNHQKISTTQATFISVPDETSSSLIKALALITDNSLGYFIVPLFSNEDIPVLLQTLATKLESESTWIENFISYPSIPKIALFSVSINLDGSGGSSNWIGTNPTYPELYYNMTVDPQPYNHADGYVAYCAGDISTCFSYTPLSVIWEMSTDGWVWTGGLLGQGSPVGTPGGWQPAKFIEINPNVGGPVTYWDGSTLNSAWEFSNNIPLPYQNPQLTVMVADLNPGSGSGTDGTNFVPNFLKATVTRPDSTVVTFISPINIGIISTLLDSSGTSVTLTASGFSGPAGTTLSYGWNLSRVGTGDSGLPITADGDGNNSVQLIETPGEYYITVYVTATDGSGNSNTMDYTPPTPITITNEFLTYGTSSINQTGDQISTSFSGWTLNAPSNYTFKYVLDTGWPTQLISQGTRIFSDTPIINYTYATSSGLGPFHPSAWVDIYKDGVLWMDQAGGTLHTAYYEITLTN